MLLTILSKTFCSISVKDEQGYTFTLFRQSNRQWRCLRCNRLRCEHAKAITALNPELPTLPPLTDEDIAALIDE